MPQRKYGYGKKAFTLIEVLLSIAIMGVFAFLAASSILGRKSENDLQNTAKQIVALTREAETKSVIQASSTIWGVHFENSTATAPFYAIFNTTSYSSSTRYGYYRLPPNVGYVTSTLALGASLEVTFAQISGVASASTSFSIYLIQNPSHAVNIAIASSGAVIFQ